MHEAIQDARSNSGCARILNCFMHLGMLEAIEIRMEIVSGNFRCLSISNCGFPAPDVTKLCAGRRLLLFGGGTRRQQAANIGNRQSVTQRVVFGAL